MSLPLRKIVPAREDVGPKTLYYEQNSETMTIPTVLPFKEFLLEKKATYNEFLSTITKQGGPMKVSIKVLAGYMSGPHAHPFPDSIWWTSRHWLDQRAAAGDKQALKVLEKHPVQEPSIEEPKEEVPRENVDKRHENFLTVRGRDIPVPEDMHIDPVYSTGQMYLYAWAEESEPGNVKIGQRWVKAGEDPLNSVGVRFREGLGSKWQKMYRDGKKEEKQATLHAYWNVQDLTERVAKDERMNPKDVRIDDYLRPAIGRRQSTEAGEKATRGEVHLWPWKVGVHRVDSALEKENAGRIPLSLSAWQHDQALTILKDLEDTHNRVFLEALAPRFGKTIWAATIAEKKKYPLMVVGSYVLSSLTSFKKDIKKYNQFENMVVIDTRKDPDYKAHIKEIIDADDGRQAVALVSLVGGSTGEGKVSNRDKKVKTLLQMDVEKLIIIDEADYGAYRPAQAKILQDSRRPEDPIILMTGTNADRAVGDFDTVWDIDQFHSVVYPQLIEERYKNNKDYTSKIKGYSINPALSYNVVPMQPWQLNSQPIFDITEEQERKEERESKASGKKPVHTFTKDENPSWSKVAEDPDRAEWFLRNMLQATFEGRYTAETGSQLHVQDLVNQTNKDQWEAKFKGPRDKPLVAMMFITADNEPLKRIGEIAQDALPNYHVVVLSGANDITNASAQDYANEQISLAQEDPEIPGGPPFKPKPVLIISSQMGARSFSVPRISELYLAFDKGQIGTTIQKVSRVFTATGKPDKIGRIFSWSFDPNRDDRWDGLFAEEANALVDQDPDHTTLFQAYKRVLATHDLPYINEQGLVSKYEVSKYIKDLQQTNRWGRVAGKSSVKASEVDPDFLKEIIKSAGRMHHVKTEAIADMGKKFESGPGLNKRTKKAVDEQVKREREIEKQWAEIKANIFDNLHTVIKFVNHKTGKNVKTLDDAFKLVKPGTDIYEALSDGFGIEWKYIPKAFETGALNNKWKESYTHE